jgi:GNAT superfamily N-acetyltransferase
VTVRVRAAILSDYRQIVEYDEFLGDRRIDLQAGELFVADIDGRPAIGYLRIAPRDFLGWPLVANLCVRKDHRRQGTGRRLMESAVADARFIRLYTSTEEGNTPMHALLERLGAYRIGHVDKLNFSGEREILYCLKM